VPPLLTTNHAVTRNLRDIARAVRLQRRRCHGQVLPAMTNWPVAMFNSLMPR